jgi:lipid A 3-O-deacylase
MGKRANAVLVAAGFLVSTESPAEIVSPGEIRIYAENDSLLNPITSTDRYYTNGVKLERLWPAERSDTHFLPGLRNPDWCRLTCGKGFRKGSVNTGYALGQNMYTPEDISIARAQPNDRPWAGLLYLSRIARITYEDTSLKAQRQDRIEVSLGVVGPASLAKQTQILVHSLFRDAQHPNGWRNQLRNEPVVQLRYDVAARWPKENGGHADIIPRVQANLGNAMISLEAELKGRVGWNLSGFGAQTIPATFVAMDSAQALPRDSTRRRKWLASGNLFLRAGIKAVAHNITLDGNSFARNDILIRRKPFVTEMGVGGEVNLVGNVWLSYQFVRRGSEFERQRGRDAPAQEFGSLTLAWTMGR